MTHAVAAFPAVAVAAVVVKYALPTARALDVCMVFSLAMRGRDSGSGVDVVGRVP